MTTSYWLARHHQIALDVPVVMGIVNVTPDSFSDGGEFFSHEKAIEHGMSMIAHGAQIVDVGGESSRPGADPVTTQEELRRVLPVVEALSPHVCVSIDTRHRIVAEAALEAGASIVNDISAGSDPAVFELAAQYEAGLVLMHMAGEPKTMQIEPKYDDVVAQVGEFLHERSEVAIRVGCKRETIALDPGLGFGKTAEHNLALMANLETISPHYPVVVGASRKAMFGVLFGLEVRDRLVPSITSAIWLAMNGASVLRVHDVADTKNALDLINLLADHRRI